MQFLVESMSLDDAKIWNQWLTLLLWRSVFLGTRLNGFNLSLPNLGCCLVIIVVGDRVPLCRPSWSGAHHIAQGNLKLMTTFLPLPPKGWNYRCKCPTLALFLLLNKQTRAQLPPPNPQVLYWMCAQQHTLLPHSEVNNVSMISAGWKPHSPGFLPFLSYF